MKGAEVLRRTEIGGRLIFLLPRSRGDHMAHGHQKKLLTQSRKMSSAYVCHLIATPEVFKQHRATRLCLFPTWQVNMCAADTSGLQDAFRRRNACSRAARYFRDAICDTLKHSRLSHGSVGIFFPTLELEREAAMHHLSFD